MNLQAYSLSSFTRQLHSAHFLPFRLTNDFIMLESFTVVTFSGVSKILKKHDKVTGFETRAKFM